MSAQASGCPRTTRAISAASRAASAGPRAAARAALKAFEFGGRATVVLPGGSGKTYTMVGNERDPGLMVMSLRDIFHQMDLDREKEFDVRCSYLEVYNEVIYDLLQVNSPGLELREDKSSCCIGAQALEAFHQRPATARRSSDQAIYFSLEFNDYVIRFTW